MQTIICSKLDNCSLENGLFNSTCCSIIKATGFLEADEINGNYMFNGTFINGRHLYIGQKKLTGIWFNKRDAIWVIGPISNLAKGQISYGYAASLAKNTSCPSMIKLWNERKMSSFQNEEYSTIAIVDCLLGSY